MRPDSWRDSDLFRLLVLGVRDYGIFMLDPGGHVVSWNPGAERIKGYTAEEIIGRHFSTFYPPEDVRSGKPEWELRVARAEGALEDEGWRVRKDGTRFWANVIITALYDDDTGELRGFGKVTRDMTERRRAEQKLTDRRRLLAHLVEAQEQERQRIAWDVHDDTIQAMVAVGMRLQLLARKIPEAHRESIDQLDDAVSSAITRLRNLVFRVRPPAIDRQGLCESLRTYLADTGMAGEVRDRFEREPSDDAAVTIFRVCQEALTNVRKHAYASGVDVDMSTVDRGFLVKVTDDGVGLPALDRDSGHFGLIEMRERAEAAGGWCTVSARADRGTEVEFWLPDVRP
ncbi:PAS domain-containing sensor histidine kinase [Lentzea sp.]|uniref:PAS domain-containing sensor histidine kinase n=1 Tax=Lentzea sp. TaxID=56099 RepID=UPI002BB7C09D|nr:PAS domain-containing sensor histidine kinase [Lentzea sp.]HUQ58769.1 PAS domain-containing sensor histidine kinase [Lentzea sp.]